MGEAKQRAERAAAAAETLTKGLANNGMLIEGGWLAFQVVVIPKDAPPAQVREMRLAFMAGAEHLWRSIFVSLDPNAEPTPADIRRMNLIEDELMAFRKEMQAEAASKGGVTPSA